MITVEEAHERLLASRPVPRTEKVPLSVAVGRVLGEPSLVAPIDVPPFANSAMDGFAVRAADLPGRLRVTGEVANSGPDDPAYYLTNVVSGRRRIFLASRLTAVRAPRSARR